MSFDILYYFDEYIYSVLYDYKESHSKMSKNNIIKDKYSSPFYGIDTLVIEYEYNTDYEEFSVNSVKVYGNTDMVFSMGGFCDEEVNYPVELYINSIGKLMWDSSTFCLLALSHLKIEFSSEVKKSLRHLLSNTIHLVLEEGDCEGFGYLSLSTICPLFKEFKLKFDSLSLVYRNFYNPHSVLKILEDIIINSKTIFKYCNNLNICLDYHTNYFSSQYVYESPSDFKELITYLCDISKLYSNHFKITLILDEDDDIYSSYSEGDSEVGEPSFGVLNTFYYLVNGLPSNNFELVYR